jgi:hypothetical protein
VDIFARPGAVTVMIIPLMILLGFDPVLAGFFKDHDSSSDPRFLVEGVTGRCGMPMLWKDPLSDWVLWQA